MNAKSLCSLFDTVSAMQFDDARVDTARTNLPRAHSLFGFTLRGILSLSNQRLDGRNLDKGTASDFDLFQLTGFNQPVGCRSANPERALRVGDGCKKSFHSFSAKRQHDAVEGGKTYERRLPFWQSDMTKFKASGFLGLSEH